MGCENMSASSPISDLDDVRLKKLVDGDMEYLTRRGVPAWAATVVLAACIAKRNLDTGYFDTPLKMTPLNFYDVNIFVDSETNSMAIGLYLEGFEVKVAEIELPLGDEAPIIGDFTDNSEALKTLLHPYLYGSASFEKYPTYLASFFSIDNMLVRMFGEGVLREDNTLPCNSYRLEYAPDVSVIYHLPKSLDNE